MTPVTAANRISAEAVQAEVGRFWDALMSKSPEVLEEFYAHESTVFGTTAVRPEPGRLAATRREREYFHPRTSLRVTTGPIEVMPLSDSAAIATYTFQLNATKIDPLTAKPVEEQVKHGRATQVFALDPEGHLRILHEHLSVSAEK